MKDMLAKTIRNTVLAAVAAAALLAGCQGTNREARQVEPSGIERRPAASGQATARGTEVKRDARTGKGALVDSANGPRDEDARRQTDFSRVTLSSENMAEPSEEMRPAMAAPRAESEAAMPSGGRQAGKKERHMVVPMGDGAGGPYQPQAPAPQRTFAAQPDTVTRYYRDIGRDRFEHKEQNPVRLVSEEPVSTFSVDVDTASYAFIRKSLMAGHLPQKDAVRVEEMINYFDYDYDTPRDRKRPFRPSVAVYPTPWNPDTKLLHIGIKGYEPSKSARPRANLVFLIDVSGSMNAPDKLPLVQNSMKMLIGTLGPDDTVGIVVYAGAAGTVLEPTSVKDRHRIISAIESLRPGGSTAGAAGIRQAYALAAAGYDKGAVNRVILATDGDFNVGITSHEELKGFVEREREKGIYLSVLGFGMGNYNDQLMQALAQNGNGNAAYIDTLSEARKVLVDEAASTLIPIARDVKIQVEFNPDKVAEYRLIGYETRMLRREDFNNDRVDAGDIGCGHTVTAIYEITPADSPARLVDDLRYGKNRGKEKADKGGGEYAYLRIRYKLPDEDESRLIELPVDAGLEYRSVEKTPSDIRFAASVAAFGQLLRGGIHTGVFGYDDVARLANSSRGDDAFGYRSEFVGLVRAAGTSASMQALQ